jgi:hypothetical protein
MKKRHALCFLALVGMLSAPAWADTDLAGKWTGTFNGVQVDIPVQAGPFGYESGESRTVQAPRYVSKTLTINFESQQKGLAVGVWNAEQFKQRFVCAQLHDSLWNCVDSTGRASVEITSASEIKVCYLDNRQGAQGAGCAVMHKS